MPQPASSTPSRHPRPHLSLRGRLQRIMWLSIMAVLVAAGLGIWKYSQFSHSKQQLEHSSEALLAELENTFKETLLVSEIQSDLILFIQTAHPETMKEIGKKSAALLGQLPEPTKPLLEQFLIQADILEIRMASLRLNNNKVLSTGTALMVALEQHNLCKGDEACLRGLARVGETFRRSRPLYINGIFNGQPRELQEAKQEISLLLASVNVDLQRRSTGLAPEQARYLSHFIGLFHELDEAITTVAAIREKVVDSEKEVLQLFDSLKMRLAELSIAHNKQAMTLAEHGLKLATNYVFLMFAGLGLVTFFAILTYTFMARSILAPLDSLGELLRKFTIMIRGIRNLSNPDKLQYQRLHDQIITRHDEIGDVGRATQALLNHIHTISEFRRKIENDNSCYDVYVRLGKIFSQELDINAFVIYEIDNDGPLVGVYSSPPELKDEMPDFTITDTCRAKRTGTVVHSFQDPDHCPICGVNDALDYCCLPMQAGGKIIGVIQFLLPMATDETKKNLFQKHLTEARNYISEALPIIQAKRYAQKLENIATQDQLTGLYNRHYLDISLPQIEAGIKRRHATLGVLLCDMDHFKAVNDTYGHPAGDSALVELADILRATVRGSDMIVRYGGEEFLILLQNIEPGEEMAVAEKIRLAVANHTFGLPEGAQRQTLSIGVTEYAGALAENMEKTLRNADIALYKAKEQGRNCVVKFNRENGQKKTAGL